MSMLTIIGRGHSGTRAIAQTLYASGVYMGELLNPTGDMMPPDRMYDACRMISRHVRWDGDLAWNFDALHTMPIPPQFTQLVRNYLLPLLKKDLPQMGWKLPETTLAYPWLVRLFPDLKYIFWVRNPRDCILSDHLTDDLARLGFGIQRQMMRDGCAPFHGNIKTTWCARHPNRECGSLCVSKTLSCDTMTRAADWKNSSRFPLRASRSIQKP